MRQRLRIGSYELLEVLGEGGMGRVYLARLRRDHGFKRHVALKVVDLEDASMRRVLPRLVNEAVTGAAFHHPGIVQVQDMGYDRDPVSGRRVGFIVMEYLDGLTFREVVERSRTRRRPIPPHLVLDLVMPVAAALHYAWEVARDDRGALIRMIHRDIKPTNLMLTRFSGVKLLDLGIVRAATNPNPTIVQSVAGTLLYMSPEQARNEELDCRTDVFSLGVVAYELAMMRRLFASSGPALGQEVREGRVGPQLSALHAVSPALAQLLRRVLAPLETRLQTPGEMLAAMHNLRRKLPSSPSLADLAAELLVEEAQTQRIVRGQADALVADPPPATDPGDSSDEPPLRLEERVDGLHGPDEALTEVFLLRPAEADPPQSPGAWLVPPAEVGRLGPAAVDAVETIKLHLPEGASAALAEPSPASGPWAAASPAEPGSPPLAGAPSQDAATRRLGLVAWVALGALLLGAAMLALRLI